MTIPLPGTLWKLATGGAVIVALLLSVLLGTTYFQNRDLLKQRQVLSASINDPVTGYIAQLAQSRTNVRQLEAAVETQNKAYDKLSVESQTQLKAAYAKLAAAQAETRVLERKIASFLATKPQGVTLEARVRDIDERAMKEFLP